MRIENVIISNLIFNEDYTRKVLPFLRDDYFEDSVERVIFTKIEGFLHQYNKCPTKETILIELDNDNKLPEQIFKKSAEYVKDISYEEKDLDWLIKNSEDFCKERALHNAIMKSISIIDGEEKDLDTGALPEILSDALAVSFDQNIGHDFIKNADDRFEYYHTKEDKIPVGLEMFDKITRGGWSRKSLNILMAGTNVGKSLAMCSMAANNLMAGKNVLYITMEMAEEKIAERIDANLLNVPIEELEDLPKQFFDKKINKVRDKTKGALIIKEYPTASANVNHFRFLLNELKLKKGFIPDIIYIDYLNICASSRIRTNIAANMYGYVKAIAEEIRGLAVEKNVPIISATQLNRAGFVNSDPGLEDTSESFGLPATCDFMAALISSDQLNSLGQMMVKQLKNRYNDLTKYTRFVIGVDRAKMKLYDVEAAAQDVTDDVPIMDQTTYGERHTEEEQMKWATKRMGRKDFSSLFN